MKVPVLYDYPPSPAGLATQGSLLYKGLEELGVDVCSVNFESAQEKEWYYRWFGPDVVAGVSYWGHSPHLVLHPQRYGLTAVPWLVADGYIANYQEILEDLPLILVTSNWMKKVQSPSDRVIVVQAPTRDWGDEQWVLGYGLFVNTTVYLYLSLLGHHNRAAALKEQMDRFTVKGDRQNRHVHEGLGILADCGYND